MPTHTGFLSSSSRSLTGGPSTQGLTDSSRLTNRPTSHQHLTLRSFAKPAAKKAAPAPAAAPAKKKKRTSHGKLYCCRNDRFRHAYEQIFPTQVLTEDEASSFRRNSRMFVVDMARSITLKNKLGMAASASSTEGSKVPANAAKSLLYESNLHLDAVGEHPRYLKIRRIGSHYATKLQNLKKIRLLLGFQRRKTVQGMYEHSLLQPGPNRMWKLVCAMEARLAMVVTRMGLAEDIVEGVKHLHRQRIHLNGCPPAMANAGYLMPGDVVTPSPDRVRFFKDYIAQGLLPLAPDVLGAFAGGQQQPSREPRRGQLSRR
ncbi:MAG: hypothetical protein WDW36_005194 [Sanguina aurantia]